MNDIASERGETTSSDNGASSSKSALSSRLLSIDKFLEIVFPTIKSPMWYFKLMIICLGQMKYSWNEMVIECCGEYYLSRNDQNSR